MTVSPEGAEWVRRRSAEIARTARWEWEREAASRTGGVLVFGVIGAVFVVRPDDGIVSVDNTMGAIAELAEECWRLVAREKAARKFPELRCLAPVRPEGATDCTSCGGRGWVLRESFLCGSCWSTGWRA